MKPYWQHFTRKYVSTVIFISIFFLITSILLGNSFESKSGLVLVSVDEIRVKEKPYKGEQTEIYIIGNKFAIWKFYSHEIDIDENKKEIKINDKILLKEAINEHRKLIRSNSGRLIKRKDALFLVGISFIFSTEDEIIAKSGVYSKGLEEDEDK